MDFRVGRVLALLKDDALATRDALDLNSKDGILLECNFADYVRDDPRVAARVRQLYERGVTVEPITCEFPGRRQTVRALADPGAVLIGRAAGGGHPLPGDGACHRLAIDTTVDVAGATG